MNVTTETEDLLPEYHFDYSKAKPNRFAKQVVNVTLDEDVAKVFTTADAVNRALRAILTALPKQQVPAHNYLKRNQQR
ncbi:MAG: hypothetical protein QX192_04725 [Methylococcales bacterium]